MFNAMLWVCSQALQLQEATDEVERVRATLKSERGELARLRGQLEAREVDILEAQTRVEQTLAAAQSKEADVKAKVGSATPHVHVTLEPPSVVVRCLGVHMHANLHRCPSTTHVEKAFVVNCCVSPVCDI